MKATLTSKVSGQTLLIWFESLNPDINHTELPSSQVPNSQLQTVTVVFGASSSWRWTVLRRHTQPRPPPGYGERRGDGAVPEPSCWLTLFRYQQHLPAATLFNCLCRSHAGYHILFEIIKNNFTFMLLSQRGRSPETTPHMNNSDVKKRKRKKKPQRSHVYYSQEKYLCVRKSTRDSFILTAVRILVGDDMEQRQSAVRNAAASSHRLIKSLCDVNSVVWTCGRCTDSFCLCFVGELYQGKWSPTWSSRGCLQ